MEYKPPGPVARAFMLSDAFIRGIRGPVGSGKSTCCIMDMWRTACMQKKDAAGRRRYRGLIIRNTYGELESTTIKSFLMWFPETVGKLTYGAPIEYRIEKRLPDGSMLDAEFLFLALDRPEHVRKLLSLEVTQVWMNEARELVKAVLDHCTVRVGRYPAIKDGGAMRAGIIMDTNSPDTDHWWPKLSDLADDAMVDSMRALEEELRSMGALPIGQRLMEFFTQAGAETVDGRQNNDAENLENLPVGYYVKAKVGKSQEWINIYIRNNYGFVMDGKAVYPEYRDNLHVVAFSFMPSLPVHIGIDFGLTPAAIFAQRSPLGQIRWLTELTATRLGAKNFAKEIKVHLADKYPAAILGSLTGDPAGTAGAQTDETTAFQMLASEGVIAKPASTNNFEIRREAVATPMGLLIDGQPGLVLHPDMRMTRKGMAGGYHFKRIKVSDERYTNEPVKNMFSHPCEAGQYLNLGLGIGKDVIKMPDIITKQRANRPQFANMDMK